MTLSAVQYATLKAGIRASLSGYTYGERMPFPATVSPAIWMDGRQPVFTDLAGTTLAADGALFGRSNEVSPLTSNWQAPSVGQRGKRDPTGFRCDYYGSAQPGNALYHTSTPSIDTTACTLAITYVTRDAAGSPQQGLLRAGSFGLFAANGVTFATHSNGTMNWQPAVQQFVAGQRVTTLVVYAASGLKCWQLVDGALTSASLVSGITGGASANQYIIANGSGADQGFYGSIGQAIVVNSSLSNEQALQLLYWMDAQILPEAFPAASKLFAIGGDSIARDSPGAPAYQSWWVTALNSIRSTYPASEAVNLAVGGSGVDNAYSRIAPYYASTRARNVYILATGTNNLANGNGQVYTRDGLFREYDAALAAGWRPALATILDRTAGLSISQAAYDSQRAFVNAALLASGRTIIDLTGVSQLSANGAANNATYFIDQIHPGFAGHALMEPIYRAAMLALAA